MKANELMLRDLIYRKCSNGNEVVKMQPHWFNPPYEFSDIFEPIPLTPEILEKNGFEQNENVKGYQYPNDDIIFCLEELSRVFIFNGVYNDICIFYVHELQHILRICGLTELADNFKIE